MQFSKRQMEVLKMNIAAEHQAKLLFSFIFCLIRSVLTEASVTFSKCQLRFRLE